MLRRALLSGVAAVPLCAMAPKRVAVLGNRGPTLDLNFISGAPLDSRITFTRASTATDGLYTDATGSSFNSFLTNAARLNSASGLLIEEQRTNSLLNSGAPATQTTASLTTGTYTLWVVGPGSATSSAGTATGSGFGAATVGTPNTFTLTGAGTVIVTVSGSLTRFQLENGSFATSYIPTTGSAATRAKDVASISKAGWFNPNASTLQVEARLPFSNSIPVEIAGFWDGTTNNKTSINIGAAHTVNIFDLTSTLNVSLGAAPIAATFKAAYAFRNGAQAGVMNGGTQINASAATLTSGLIGLTIGCDGVNQQLNGYIRRVRYWPRMLSQSELNQVTL